MALRTSRLLWVLLLVGCLSMAGRAEEAAKDNNAAPVKTVEKAEAPEAASDARAEPPEPEKAPRFENLKLRMREGFWRFEATGALGIRTRERDGRGDYMASVTAEYEMPLTQRFTLGLRVMPFLVYTQKSDETVYAGGIGLIPRVYWKKEAYNGLFAEFQGHLIGNINHFEDNVAHVNFHIGGGVGYKFDTGWHAIVKIEHISNANTRLPNRGINTLSLGIGYSF